MCAIDAVFSDQYYRWVDVWLCLRSVINLLTVHVILLTVITTTTKMISIADSDTCFTEALVRVPVRPRTHTHTHLHTMTHAYARTHTQNQVYRHAR